MNPQEIATRNRRRNLANWRRRKGYREKLKKLLEGKTCEWCGTTENLQIHHISLTSYKTYKTYLDDLSRGMILCRRCHVYGLHKGLHICPVCKKNLTANNECWNCLSPDDRKMLRDKKKFWKELKKKWARDQWRKQKLWRKEHVRAKNHKV